MDPVENKSKTKLLIVIGIIVVFVIIAGAVYALVRTNQSPQNTQSNNNQPSTSPTDDSRNVTTQVLQQDLTDLDSSIKKSQEFHSAAKAAVDDPAKRIKVGE